MELRNISGNSQKAGFTAELAAIQHFKKKHYKLLCQRLKTPFGEIDLVMKNKNHILLLEVKTLNSSWRAFDRLGEKQLIGMRRNLLYFVNKFKQVQFDYKIVWVQKNKIESVSINE